MCGVYELMVAARTDEKLKEMLQNAGSSTVKIHYLRSAGCRELRGDIPVTWR